MGTNSETVMGIYAAFGRGDVDHIMSRLSDGVRWDEGIRDTGLPYLAEGRGKEHVARFFGAVAANIEFTAFEPGPPCEAGDTVMVAIREEARNIVTGLTIPADVYVHIWKFDVDGKVAALRHVGDFAMHERAARASATVG